MTSEAAFDPTAPLAGPPDPWQSTSTPSTRSGPPYHMTDMIAAEPSLARRIVERLASPRSRQPPGSRRRSARHSRRATRSSSPAAAPPSTPRWPPSEILREAARAADLPDARRIAASRRSSSSLAPPTRGLVIGDQPRGRDDRDERGPRGSARRRPSTAVITVSRRSPAGGVGRDRRRDRGARPGLVPHRRLSQPDRGGGGRRARISPGDRSTRSAVEGLLAAGTRDESRRGTHRRPPSRTHRPSS